MAKKFYLAGPMSGIPDFNFPAFHEAAGKLREAGHEIVSPAEMDEAEGVTGGDFANGVPEPEEYWRLLARDVQTIGTGCDGIVFLPDWFHSRGAKLEAMAGLMAELEFFYYQNGEMYSVTPLMIRAILGVRTNVNY